MQSVDVHAEDSSISIVIWHYWFYFIRFNFPVRLISQHKTKIWVIPKTHGNFFSLYFFFKKNTYKATLYGYSIYSRLLLLFLFLWNNELEGKQIGLTRKEYYQNRMFPNACVGQFLNCGDQPPGSFLHYLLLSLLLEQYVSIIQC